MRTADTAAMIQKKYPTIRNHHKPNFDWGFVPKVKKLVGASGLRIKNLPRKNIPIRHIDGSKSEISIRKIGLPQIVFGPQLDRKSVV